MEKRTVVEEVFDLIAVRVPPGDKWKLIDSNGDQNGITYSSLTDTLEAWFQKTQEQVSFRLDPLDSKLYAIRFQEMELKPEPVKTFSLYGEFSQTNESN